MVYVNIEYRSRYSGKWYALGTLAFITGELMVTHLLDALDGLNDMQNEWRIRIR